MYMYVHVYRTVGFIGEGKYWQIGENQSFGEIGFAELQVFFYSFLIM